MFLAIISVAAICLIQTTIGINLHEYDNCGISDPFCGNRTVQCEYTATLAFIWLDICAEYFGKAVTFTDTGRVFYSELALQNSTATICDSVTCDSIQNGSLNANSIFILSLCAYVVTEVHLYAKICNDTYTYDYKKLGEAGKLLTKYNNYPLKECRPNLPLPDSAAAPDYTGGTCPESSC